MSPVKVDRFIALDAMRGICAIIVATFHFKSQSIFSNLPFVQNGFLFVDFFFVLSGFVIAANYQEKIGTSLSIVDFMLLRLGRIYPLHLFVLLLFAAVALVKSSSGYSLIGFATTALLLQSFIPDNVIKAFSIDLWNFPSWSIAAEMWTYLIFAVLCRYVSPRQLVYSFFLLAIVCPAILDLTSDRYQNVFFFPGAIPRCLFGFSLGLLALRFWLLVGKRTLGSCSPATCTILEFVCLSASFISVSLVGAGPFSNVCTPIFAATILIFARAGGMMGFLFQTKPFALIGALSYSIYMLHLFIQSRLLNLISIAQSYRLSPLTVLDDQHHTVAGPAVWVDLAVVLMVCTTIVGSYVTFRLIEEPCRKWSKRVVPSAPAKQQHHAALPYRRT